MRHISPRGRSVLIACFVVGGGLLTGVASGAESVGWMSAIIATFAGMLSVAALSRLGGSAPGEDFFSAMRLRLGAFFSGVVTLILTLMAAGLLLRDLAVITKFVGANMISGTPEVLIGLSFALVAAWCAASGRSTVGRWAELIALPMLLLLVFAFALAARDFDVESVTDGLLHNSRSILPGAVGAFAESFGSGLICGVAIFPFGAREKRKALPLIAGVAIGGAVLTVVYLMNVALLGSQTIELFNFPTYHALRVSGVDGVLERMEALLMLPAVMLIFLRVAAGLTFLAEALGRGSKRVAESRWTPFVIAIVAVFISLAVFPSQIEIRERSEPILWIYAVLWALTAAVFAAAGARQKG